MKLIDVLFTNLHPDLIRPWAYFSVNLLSSISRTRICLVDIITMLLQCYLNKLRLRQVETFESLWYQWRTNQAFTNTKERLLWIQESNISKQFTNFYQAFRCCVIISFNYTMIGLKQIQNGTVFWIVVMNVMEVSHQI